MTCKFSDNLRKIHFLLHEMDICVSESIIEEGLEKERKLISKLTKKITESLPDEESYRIVAALWIILVNIAKSAISQAQEESETSTAIH